MGEAVANELLFAVPVAPILFFRGTLPESLVDHDLIQVAQIVQISNGAG